MSGAIHIWSSGEVLSHSDLNEAFAVISGGYATALNAATTAESQANAAVSSAAVVSAAVVSLGGQVSNLSSAAVAAEDAAVANGGSITSLEGVVSTLETQAEAVSSAAAENSSSLSVLSGAVTSSQAEILSAGSASSASTSAVSALSASIGQPGGLAVLSSGTVPLSEMPYTAGEGIVISGGEISVVGGAGVPDAYVYFGGAATETSGEYAFGIRASKGISSITHMSTGCYVIEFETPFADANWIGIYSGGFGGDNSGATSGDTSVWDETEAVISEHRGGEYPSRSTSQVILQTMYATATAAAAYDLARISCAFWAAPTGMTITNSGTVSTAS